MESHKGQWEVWNPWSHSFPRAPLSRLTSTSCQVSTSVSRWMNLRNPGSVVKKLILEWPWQGGFFSHVALSGVFYLVLQTFRPPGPAVSLSWCHTPVPNPNPPHSPFFQVDIQTSLPGLKWPWSPLTHSLMVSPKVVTRDDWQIRGHEEWLVTIPTNHLFSPNPFFDIDS